MGILNGTWLGLFLPYFLSNNSQPVNAQIGQLPFPFAVHERGYAENVQGKPTNGFRRLS